MENPPAENLPYMPFLLGLVALAGLIVAVSTVFDTPKPEYEGTAVAFVNELLIMAQPPTLLTFAIGKGLFSPESR